MNVISNTSPLIAFAKIECLPILKVLFHSVTIPRMVYEEFFDNCTPTESAHFLAVYREFIQIVDVAARHEFARRLGQGEQEVLSLALQEHADLILLDDRKACNEARAHNLVVASTRAVLKIAEERRLIASYQQAAETLQKQQFHLPNY